MHGPVSKHDLDAGRSRARIATLVREAKCRKEVQTGKTFCRVEINGMRGTRTSAGRVRVRLDDELWREPLHKTAVLRVKIRDFGNWIRLIWHHEAQNCQVNQHQILTVKPAGYMLVGDSRLERSEIPRPSYVFDGRTDSRNGGPFLARHGNGRCRISLGLSASEPAVDLVLDENEAGLIKAVGE